MYEGQGGLDLLPGQDAALTDPVIAAASGVAELSRADAAIVVERFERTSPLVRRAHRLRDKGDLVAAVAEYQRAADEGNAAAMYNAGVLLKPSSGNALTDPTCALSLLQRAAAEPPGWRMGGRYIQNLGVAEAENALGVSYRDGDGVDIDLSRAREWFIRSARHGCVWGQNNACYSFLHGQGGAKDLDAARAWFEKAVALHLPDAKLNLALMLAHGQGGPRDTKRARELLQAAAARGLLKADLELAEMDRTGADGAPRPEAAAARLRAAAERGDVHAM